MQGLWDNYRRLARAQREYQKGKVTEETFDRIMTKISPYLMSDTKKTTGSESSDNTKQD